MSIAPCSIHWAAKAKRGGGGLTLRVRSCASSLSLSPCALRKGRRRLVTVTCLPQAPFPQRSEGSRARSLARSVARRLVCLPASPCTQRLLRRAPLALLAATLEEAGSGVGGAERAAIPPSVILILPLSHTPPPSVLFGTCAERVLGYCCRAFCLSSGTS